MPDTRKETSPLPDESLEMHENYTYTELVHTRFPHWQENPEIIPDTRNGIGVVAKAFRRLSREEWGQVSRLLGLPAGYYFTFRSTREWRSGFPQDTGWISGEGFPVEDLPEEDK